jgi:hypothetical protein
VAIGSSAADGDASVFTFEEAAGAPVACLEDRDTRELFKKWCVLLTRQSLSCDVYACSFGGREHRGLQRVVRVAVCVRCRDLEQLRYVGKFRFDKRFDLEALPSFLTDFFNDPFVRSQFKVWSERGAAVRAGGFRVVTVPLATRLCPSTARCSRRLAQRCR